MIRSLKDFFRGLWVSKPPRFQHLQVEVTTRCDLPGCLMCPRRAWPERWLNHDLSWQNFERLIPALKLFTHVHLSGWGEPLLHPRLWDMAQAARSQGCTVSLTTNGMNLTEAMQVQVLEHLDMVAVSLDGARAETFERLRPGADFQRVTQQVAALCSRKRSLGRQRPEVVLLFMKMRPNVAELPDLLQLAAELGVDRVNATNLDFIAAPAMEGLTLVSSGPDPEITAIFEQAQRQAEKSSLPFRNVGLTPSARSDSVRRQPAYERLCHCRWGPISLRLSGSTRSRNFLPPIFSGILSRPQLLLWQCRSPGFLRNPPTTGLSGIHHRFSQPGGGKFQPS